MKSWIVEIFGTLKERVKAFSLYYNSMRLDEAVMSQGKATDPYKGEKKIIVVNKAF